ncbi:hypothetical protein D3C86_1396880 [compost metagenome]
MKKKIAGFEAEIAELKKAAGADQLKISNLQAEVSRIQSLLDAELAAHTATKAALAGLQVQYNDEVAAHNVTKQEKSSTESELIKANEKVNELKVQSDAVAADTAGKVPMTQAEIDALEAVRIHPIEEPDSPQTPLAPVDPTE